MKRDTIIWDFDGVIVFSDAIRIQAFEYSLRKVSPKIVEKFLVYHRDNGGISRFDKFSKFFEDKDCAKYLDDYSQYIKENLFKKNVINKEVINRISSLQSYNHIICSASETVELNALVEFLNLRMFFSAVFGSPESKVNIVAKLKKYYSIKCLVGDSINDYQAAVNNNIAFVSYNNFDLENLSDFEIKNWLGLEV